MKGHTGIMVLVLLVGLLVMTGCEKRYTESEMDTIKESDTESRTESETDTEPETNPDTVMESVESEKVTETKAQKLQDFDSSLGYHILYDDSLFEYSRSRDYDEIVLKGQTFSSKPPVFFAAMKIENEEVQDIVDEIFTEDAGQTVIGKEAYTALCQPTVECEGNGAIRIHHNQYLVQLVNGDALLFEVQWYEEDDISVNGEKLADMLDSIAIEQPVLESFSESQSAEETEEQTESRTETDEKETDRK